MKPHSQLGLAAGLLLLAAALGGGTARAQSPPEGLPRYDFDIRLDLDRHEAHVRQRVTWVNRHAKPAQELVFNVFPAYQVPAKDLDFEAHMLEIYRLAPSEALDVHGHALTVERISLSGQEAVSLAFRCQEQNPTALVVPLPHAVGPGESVTVELEFTLRLPQKQGRWGQWQGVTTLVNWYPALAYYDEQGWQPVPFVLWHPPVYQEAGVYSARLTLPRNQVVACSCPFRSAADVGEGLQQLDFAPRVARDFALVASARFHEFTAEADGVHLRCLAFAEHEHYARAILGVAAEALAVYAQWFGAYPYPEFTIVETFTGWVGTTGSAMVLLDEQLFAFPHAGQGLVELIVAQQTCRQWWYGVVGTNGYSETWMDEGLATYFAHRFLDLKVGRNNPLLRWPKGLGWLPTIPRDSMRYANLYGTLARGEAGPTVQDVPKFEHSVNLASLASDRGAKIVGMIESRLGEPAFLGLMRQVYAHYGFRILRVADFERELEACTGRSWEDFFRNWLYGAGMTDWCIEKVEIAAAPPEPGDLRRGPGTARRVTVLLRQKADYDEPTTLGFCLDGGDGYQVRVPIDPQAGVIEIADPPGRVEALPDHRVRVEVVLSCRPTQVAVDPDQVLVDREPANNFWKTPVRWRLLPVYTGLEESDLTCAYDRWNVIAGPWVSDVAYTDPFNSFTEVFGFRVGAYRTQQFVGGVYSGFRSNYGDLVVGADGLWDHWPWPHTQVGFNAEKSLTTLEGRGPGPDRGIVYGRYVFEETSSLYQLPMHFVELFASATDNALPPARDPPPGTEQFLVQNTVGLQYHVNDLTPYWDPEQGFQLDVTLAEGLPVFGQARCFSEALAQVSCVQSLPEGLGYLSETRLAARLFGAAALPDRALLITLGGGSRFRGFDRGERQGSLVWVGSLEWRLPVVRRVDWAACDHAVALRNAYLATFYDAGDAYARGQPIGPVAHAVGAGLRFDVAWFSFFEHTILRFDAAKTVNANAPVQFWFGVEHPF